MQSISQSQSSPTPELPPGLSRLRAIKEILSIPPLISGNFEVGGEKGAFYITQPKSMVIAGQEKESSRFFVSLGSKILEIGEVQPSSRMAADFDLRLKVSDPSLGFGERNKSRSFEIETDFQRPARGVLRIKSDGVIESSGAVSVKILSGKAHEMDSDGTLPKLSSVTKPVSRENLSPLRNAQGVVTQFDNTLFVFCVHTPEMVPTLERLIETRLGGSRPKLLNFLLETAEGTHTERFLSQHAPGSDFTSGINLTAARLANKFDSRYQLQLIDYSEEDTDIKRACHSWLKSLDLMQAEVTRLGSSFIRPPKENPNALFERIEEANVLQHQSSSLRESLVRRQLGEKCLAPIHQAVNVVIMGAYHYPLVQMTPGAQAGYAVLPFECEALCDDALVQHLNVRAPTAARIRERIRNKAEIGQDLLETQLLSMLAANSYLELFGRYFESLKSNACEAASAMTIGDTVASLLTKKERKEIIKSMRDPNKLEIIGAVPLPNQILKTLGVTTLGDPHSALNTTINWIASRLQIT